MNELNIKRCLRKIGFCGILLCVSLSAAARELDAAGKPSHQPVVATLKAPTKTEEVKAEGIKNEEAKAAETQTQQPAAVGIKGLASFYAAKFHGKRTASGEKLSSELLTAAHLTLPFGTKLKVTNTSNNESVIVRVNDRGPHVRGRLIDLSRAAADHLGITRRGVAQVEIEILKP